MKIKERRRGHSCPYLTLPEIILLWWGDKPSPRRTYMYVSTPWPGTTKGLVSTPGQYSQKVTGFLDWLFQMYCECCLYILGEINIDMLLRKHKIVTLFKKLLKDIDTLFSVYTCKVILIFHMFIKQPPLYHLSPSFVKSSQVHISHKPYAKLKAYNLQTF